MLFAIKGCRECPYSFNVDRTSLIDDPSGYEVACLQCGREPPVNERPLYIAAFERAMSRLQGVLAQTYTASSVTPSNASALHPLSGSPRKQATL